MKENATIPEDIRYRIWQQGNRPYQPQYKDKTGEWKNFIYVEDDGYGESRKSREYPKSFAHIEDAEKFIDEYRAMGRNKTFYKDEWT